MTIGDLDAGAAPAASVTLSDLRQRIDDLDTQIAELLQERAAVAREVGQRKDHGRAAPVYVPEREAEVLARVRSATGPLDPEALTRIYREILSASRALQRPLRIAHLGPRATFGHQAALTAFGGSALYTPCASNTDVFTTVERGEADYGLIPFENSTEGPVNEVLDRLVDTPLQVCAEVPIPVAHTLMSQAEGLEEIRTVLTHPQAAAQSRGWLAAHLPGVPVEPAASTGGAAEIAAREPGIAAIAPRLAADVFGLNVLAENIQDLTGNVTRFLVLGHAPSARPSGRDRTAIIVSIRHRVGALRDFTEIFARANVNLSSIQSRPSRRRAWDYLFFVEMEGHLTDPGVVQALHDAREQTVFLKVVGSWPAPGD